jgi:hypothetical protein
METPETSTSASARASLCAAIRRASRLLAGASVALAALLTANAAEKPTTASPQAITVEYYADHVDRNGLAEGVIPLTAAQVAKRATHYRFEKVQGKLHRVVRANSTGTPLDEGDDENLEIFGDTDVRRAPGGRESRPAIQLFEYDKTGLTKTIFQNSKTRTLATLVWSGENYSRASIQKDASITKAENMFWHFGYDWSDSEVLGYRGGEIHRLRLKRDAAGHVIRKEFFRHADNETVRARSAIAYGFDYTLDALGRVVEARTLGYDGAPRPRNWRVASIKHEYDRHGNICKTAFFGKNGQPVLDLRECAVRLEKSNDDGNIVEIRFLDTAGNLWLGDVREYAKLEFQYDADGNITKTKGYDQNGKPIPEYISPSTAVYETTTDANNNRIEEFYLGDPGKATLLGKRVKVERKYDEKGNEVEVTFLDLAGKPCSSPYGEDYAKEVTKYDAHNAITEKAYYGADGKLFTGPRGVAKWQVKYDERGNATEIAYYGKDGKLCLRDDGYRQFNDGYAKCVAKYDERRNCVEKTYYGADGKPMLRKSGFAKTASKYDSRGNKIEQSFYDENGKPCLHKDGYTKWTARLDEFNREIEKSTYGLDGAPCLSSEGYAKVTHKYGEFAIETAYFGIDGKPRNNKDKYAKTVSKQDEAGTDLEVAYYGEDGKPCFYKEGYARKVFEHNADGEPTGISYYGDDGKLCLVWDGEKAFARALHTAQSEEQKTGKTQTAYYDEEGKLSLNGKGFAIVRTTHSKRDATGKTVEDIRYFGADEKPCLAEGWHGEKGFARRVTIKKPSEETTEVLYYGVDGKLCLINNGYAIERETSKDTPSGSITETTYYGADEKPCLHKDGFAKNVTVFNAQDKTTESAYYGLDGKLVTPK